MFEYFYNEILRRTIISFGTLFNGISVEQKNESDQTGSNIRVPLAYGPTQKFLARLEQQPDLNKGVAITLPRMSFEFTGLTYDPTRKVTTTQQFTVADPADGSETKKAFMPVPYNLDMELYVMAKNSNGFFIQDAAAAWSGIWVVDFGNANTSVGDEIEVKIVTVDRKSRTLGVSIKAKDMADEEEAVREHREKESDVAPTTIGDLIKQQMGSGSDEEAKS